MWKRRVAGRASDGGLTMRCGTTGRLVPSPRVYRRGRQALAAVRQKPTVEFIHEWRKQAKYLRYQLDLLRPLAPTALTPLAKTIDRLGDLLGDDHDLAVLRREVAGRPRAIWRAGGLRASPCSHRSPAAEARARCGYSGAPGLSGSSADLRPAAERILEDRARLSRERARGEQPRGRRSSPPPS
jgi:CHAD domain